MIEADYPAPPPQDFWVVKENWLAVQLFEACTSQFECHPSSGMPQRLNYPAVEVVIKRRFPKVKQKHFEQLQLLERVVINYVHKHLQSQSKYRR